MWIQSKRSNNSKDLLKQTKQNETGLKVKFADTAAADYI